jgi:hypothetical protein
MAMMKTRSSPVYRQLARYVLDLRSIMAHSTTQELPLEMRGYMRQLEYEFPVTELRNKVKWCYQKVKEVHMQQQKRG